MTHDGCGPGALVELTGADLLVVTSALDWLTSSLDDESVRLATGWPAVGVAWLSSTLSGPVTPRSVGSAALIFADDLREALAAQGFMLWSESVVGRTVSVRFRRPVVAGPEPRLAIDVVGGEQADDPTVHVHVRVGVHDFGIEGALAEMTDSPAGRPQPVTDEVFLLDLVPDAPASEWVRIGPGERQSGCRALLRDIAESATVWWAARADRAALIEMLSGVRHRALTTDRRVAAGLALAGDPAGAESALRRQVGALASLSWPAEHYTAAFLARFADRFGLDLTVTRPAPVPSGGAHTPVMVNAGSRFVLDQARATVLVAALGVALDEDDFEFEMAIGPSKAQAREIRRTFCAVAH